ncbi:MAG: threonine--tRNA ligase [Actinomycetales bacterium]|nr:threonine--tRNA ligase [Actinomycetales bacterium]
MPVSEDDQVEPVAIDSDEGRTILRHSTAHVLAQAVQQLQPQARLGIGPPIADGFYYDFDVPEPFTPPDLRAIEKAMARIVRAGQPFRRRTVTPDEARAVLAGEPYKLELVDLKGGENSLTGETPPLPVAGESSPRTGPTVDGVELTMYDNCDPQTGEIRWSDLCRGPHLPTTAHIPAHALLRTAAAYWRGDSTNPQLQRIYGTAWEDQAALADYVHRRAEAERRDHRRLGVELDLFSFPEEIGSGLAVFHPRGGIVRRVMEDYSRERHAAAGYEFVFTPHVSKGALFEQSGHLHWYADGMYPPMSLDVDPAELVRAGHDYYLKPMNCPFHCLIYRSRGRSYRELPIRLFEFGTVYRYEKSGVVHGLTRARGFTQDDAHIFVTAEQMPGELDGLLTFVLDLLRDYGLTRFSLELSTRDPVKSIGSDEEWQDATEALRAAAERQQLPLVIDEGGAAFYGPKISVQATDALDRSWQLSTIQVDFQLPARFGLQYQASEGSRQRPIMIHRALFGSIERFFAILLEHYAGAFPPWLAPEQAVGIPVAEQHVDHLTEVTRQLRAAGIRASVDTSADRMQRKIRQAQTMKVPFMLIAGDDDIAASAVSFRYRDGTQRNGVPVAEAVAEIVAAVAERRQV